MSDNAYSQLPYRTPGCVLPSPLALLGGGYVLFGMENHSSQFRCLDIGCGIGMSTIRLAQELPDCEFLGIDLSGEQIKIADDEVKKRGLKNVAFRCENFLDLPTDESFDLVYCYGVLSYCPPDLHGPLVQKISDSLTPDGIALMSYNVYPGWRYKGALRDVMMVEIDRSQPPAVQVQTAKSFTKYYINNLPQNSVHRFMMQQLYGEVERQDDAYLFHEYLEEENHAFHFRDFIRLCENAGLRFASEFPYSNSCLGELFVPTQFIPYLRKRLSQNRSNFEAAVDLTVTRSFRRSILYNSERIITKEDPARFRTCCFRLGPLTFALQEEVEDIQPNHTLDIVAPYGGKKTLDKPHEIAILFLLKEDKEYLDLWEKTKNVPAVKDSGGITEEIFLQSLLKLMLHGFIIPIPRYS